MPCSTDHYFLEHLGVKAGKALGVLKKAIMFSLVIETGRNICYRCGEEIINTNEFSIEHIENWILSNNPKDRFYNLKNIAFSHRKCNTTYAKNSKGKSKIKPLKDIKELDNYKKA